MIKDEIGQLVNDTAALLNLLIYEWSMLLKGENSKITVKIDNPRQPVSHQNCEEFSRSLTDKIDESGLLPNYTLEVSSPGLNRKLRTIEELQRFIQSPVKIVYDNGKTRVSVSGTLQDIRENVIHIYTREKKELSIQYSSIKSANLDY